MNKYRIVYYRGKDIFDLADIYRKRKPSRKAAFKLMGSLACNFDNVEITEIGKDVSRTHIQEVSLD